MLLCVRKDVTSNSEVYQPDTLRPSVKGGAYPLLKRYDGWGGNGTACAVGGIESRDVGATGGNTAVWELGCRREGR